ncbi:HD domain-containing protein [Sandarakinorhabdus sp. DWP1-3-1]|uniref:HD domain-containing protein n=1 Tax=Sandarakinorhabdus sp. DWP1-3-1 TaxID=2804627 RepID=UPI003CEF2D95
MFTTMLEGTRDDWGQIAKAHMEHQVSAAPQQIMESLRRLETIEVGFGANQLQHSLMTATLARRDGASDEEIVAALCHDIGKLMSIPNHGPIAAEILKPYVSEDLYHAVKWHQDFQGKYYYEYLGKPADMRERFRQEPWFATAEKLVDRWDAPAFDPAYDSDSLESFEPEVTRVFSRPVRAY